MERLGTLETATFRRDYPEMVSRPEQGFVAVLKGNFRFSAAFKEKGTIEDSYRLIIKCPESFPREVPIVFEIGGRIPRDERHHVNPDGSFCLGSPLRLKGILSKVPTLVGFAERCLVPYLYSMSRCLMHGEPLIFGELAHGSKGEINDYCSLFGLRTPEQVLPTINLLGLKKRHANKQPCPCGCGLRLGKCHLHYRLNEFRKLECRTYYRSLAVRLK